MADLASRLTQACAAAFAGAGLDPALGVVKRSDRPDLADFQCNGAMAAAKAARRNPREIAGEIAAALAGHELIERVEIAGPGFLNIVVAADVLAARAEEVRGSDRAGAPVLETPERVVVDFGGPNVAKPMHVGHLRSAVIGDTLQRLMRFLGDDVISDAHLGDWGLQMGLLLVAVQDEMPDLPYFVEGSTGPFPAQSPVTIDDLARIYPAASSRAKTDKDYELRAQQAVAAMQHGNPGARALLRHFIDVSVAALKVDYDFLNVSFDLWKGESDVDTLIEPVIALFREKGLAREDAGALIVDVARESDKKEMPPVMLVNSRGATGYHTTDLATILDRVESIAPRPERMIYVVDQRQALHFEQVFRAADLAGLFPEDHLEHIGFGTVNGPDGKPFKTREGGVLRLADLNVMALKEAKVKIDEAAKLPEDMGQAERDEVARSVAVAALRFSDLMNVRTTNYVFDLEKFTSFEGKTGPYLLYQAVRIKSLLRRAAEAGHAPGRVAVAGEKERALVLALDGFGAALLSSREKRMPHFLCEHVYGLSQAFAAFYAAHDIAREVDEAARASRLALCEAVLAQLETGLGILGITVPERM